MQSLQKFAVVLTYPPALTLLLLFAATALLLLRQHRTGMVVAVLAMAWSGLLSIPVASDWVRGRLEQRYRVVEERELPQADAIVVLGGGSSYRWINRPNVSADDLESSRLAAGARAWLAGRAPVVILSGGGDNGGERDASEARRMAHAIGRLGVPESALLLEDQSRNTRDNARYTAALADEHGFHRVLLVTSSLHMPRAVLQFSNENVDVIPVPVPERARRDRWTQRWIPSRSALWRSGRAIKEFGAIVMARLQN
ncbi:YdcF family protein [Lysobacter panacisoli]|uniref:YdcF family protein n=1 Tax=Lysobacter panacisoli TaxID=1255263 RepID=A0ABP9LCV4_9GAMM|nr:YdcF family protein [Lysobacter panacisoli]